MPTDALSERVTTVVAEASARGLQIDRRMAAPVDEEASAVPVDHLVLAAPSVVQPRGRRERAGRDDDETVTITRRFVFRAGSTHLAVFIRAVGSHLRVSAGLPIDAQTQPSC